LEDRIQAELMSGPRAGTLPAPRRSWLDRILPAIGWSAAGAAAAILIVRFSDPKEETPPREVSALLAAAAEAEVELEHELLDVADAGIVEESAEGIARVVRYESLERRRWTGEDGAVTVLEVPREDLVFVPVTFQ
jgi:hypothetical protein